MTTIRQPAQGDWPDRRRTRDFGKTLSILEARDDWRAPMAVLAAAAGTGFGSGRAIALCFSQLGRWSWPGIVVGSCVFAGLLEGLSRAATRPGQAAGVLRGILMTAVAAMMLRTAAHIGELTLPSENAALIGAVAGLCAALLANLRGQRALPWLGLTAVLGSTVFSAGLALDPRSVAGALSGAALTKLPCPPAAAVLLGTLYGCANGCVALGTAGGFRRPGSGLGWKCGAALCAVLLCVNAAIRSGGATTLLSRAPIAFLAARWGRAGFLLSAGLAWLCAVCTLSAAVGDALRAAARKNGEKRC